MSLNINHNHNDINTQLQNLRSAVSGTNDIVELKAIQNSVHDLYLKCEKASELIDINYIKWTKLKWKCFKIENKISNKLTLIEKRQNLYQSSELPDIPPLPKLLNGISENHPSLKTGIQHFQKVLDKVMRIDNSSVSSQDIKNLIAFQSAIENEENKADLLELRDSVSRLIKLLQSTLSRKKELLARLHPSMNYEKYDDEVKIEDWKRAWQKFNNPDEWADEDKIKIFVQAEQILNNPFEPKIDPIDVLPKDSPLHKLLSRTIPKSQKKTYWDWMPPLERQAVELANTPEKMEILIKAKTDGLRNLALPINPNDPSRHLIAGAGPSGLIHALCFKMLGKQFDIVERRGENKNARPNTVTLGKWETKELEILFFFGAIHRMRDKISFGHNRPYYNELRLGDIEDTLIDVLKDLNDGVNPIQYNTCVENIDKNGVCTLSNHVVTHPTTVIVGDGLNGTTKGLLGIEQKRLSKKTLIHFSIFHKPENARFTSTFKHMAINVAKAGLLAIKMVGLFILHRKSFEETYAMAIDGGPTGLSCLPSQDYLIRILKREEQDVLIAKFQSQLKLINLKMKKHDKDPEKLKKLKQKQAEIIHDRDSYLTKKAKSKHGMFDILHSLYHPQGHKMRLYPLEHKQNYLVDIVISKAERPMMKLGKTTFLLRGDACHTTDPYSGTGCKTAQEEILPDQYFLQNPNLVNASTLELSILNYGQDHYQQKMIDKGFEERFMYYQGTEKAARFLDLALKHQLVNEQQSRLFKKLEYKLRHGLVLTKEDIAFKNQLRKQLLDLLKNYAELPPPEFVDDGWKMKPATLTDQEKGILRNITSRLQIPTLYAQWMTIATKLACDSDPRGPLIYMLKIVN